MSGDRRERRERPERNWRDVDRKKDQSAHRQDGRPAAGNAQRPISQKGYRAALDRLFDSGRIGSLVEQSGSPSKDADANSTGDDSRLKMLRKIRDAEGRPAVTQAVDSYLKQYELPDDAEVLAKVLEHRDIERQREAIERLLVITERDKPKRARALLGQLRFIRDIGDDPELSRLAETLIERLD